jgi:ribosomal protein L23
MPGRRTGYKKAYVRLQSGQSIDFTGSTASSRNS